MQFCISSIFCPISANPNTENESPGGGVLHYGVRRGCAPVLVSFWPENSGIGIYFYLKISVIGLVLSLGIFWD